MFEAPHDQTTASVPSSLVEDDRMVDARIRAEYQEVPGLSLTLPQAARLFNLDRKRCARLFAVLIADGALWTNGREFLGRSVRKSSGVTRRSGRKRSR